MKTQKLLVAGAFILLCQISVSAQYVVASTTEEDATQYEQINENGEREINLEDADMDKYEGAVEEGQDDQLEPGMLQEEEESNSGR